MGSGCPRLAAERSRGSWYLPLELGTGTDGRRRRVYRGGFATRKSALEALARLRGPARSPLTVGEWPARWPATTRAPSTVAGYADVSRYLNPLLDRPLLAELSMAHVKEMFQIITREHRESERRLKAATLDRIRATLRAPPNGTLRAAPNATLRQV
jgi:hypothetical protein